MYDLVVIGAGSGGVRCARMAAAKGARVAIIEERFFGGTCVNVGCVPKKLFVYASHFADEFLDAKGFGWEVANASFDWPTLVENKNTEIARLNGIYESMLQKASVDIFEGRGVLQDRHTVRVTDQAGTRRDLEARNILVATGSYAFVPALPGREHAVISDDMFYLESLPKKAFVVGGGYIAVEFAGILAGLGVATELIYRGEQILKRFDQDIRDHLTAEIQAKGIRLHLGEDIRSIEKDGEQLTLSMTSGASLQGDLVLYATGRRPLTEGLGLEQVGVELTDSGAIQVNENYQTSVSHIFAVGDVIDRVQLTPVALAEGTYVANYLFGDQEPRPVDYQHIPTAVFSQPSVATIGLTEEVATEVHGDIDVYRSAFRNLKNTLSGSQEKTLMKLVVERKTQRVLGAHMVGPDAGEIIQGIAIAIRAGATKDVFDSTIGIHPSSAEEFVTMREPVEHKT